MSTAPRFAAVDEDTADLLTELAEDRVTQAAVLVEDPEDPEWVEFLAALKKVSREHHGRISPNHMRPLVRAAGINPRRVGPFFRRASLEGLILPTQQWDVSDDLEGRNSGRLVRVYTATALMPPRTTQEPC